jgi:hypothetical protein
MPTVRDLKYLSWRCLPKGTIVVKRTSGDPAGHARTAPAGSAGGRRLPCVPERPRIASSHVDSELTRHNLCGNKIGYYLT